MNLFKKKDTRILLYLSITSIIIQLFMIIAWKNMNIFDKILDTNTIAIVLFFIILTTLTIVSFLGCIMLPELLIIYIIHDYRRSKRYKAIAQETKKLSSEYSEVKIKDFTNTNLTDIVSEEHVHCFAKLDENGNIVYKIQIDVEQTTDNYIAFANKFKIRKD